MGIAFAVQEYWDLADARDALEVALCTTVDAIAEFEKAFASFVRGLDAAFLISGREAIYRALKLIGVGAGDQVVMSAFNCSRVADAILRCKATPVLVDVRLPGGEIDPDLVLQALSPQVKATLIPHVYGVPADLREIKPELDRRDVALIEDCAHCVGGTIGEKVVGSLGSFSIFSFNTGKPITLGNGGMLICSDPKWLDEFRRQKAQCRRQHSTNAQEEFEAIKKTLDAMVSLRSQASQGRLPLNPPPLKRRFLRSPLGLAGLWLYNRFRPAAPLTHPFNDEFGSVGAVRARLGLSLLRRWPDIMAVRNQKAEYVRRRLCEVTWAETCTLAPDTQPAYFQVNVFAGELTAQEVESVIGQLRRTGFWAGRWPFLNHVPHLVGRLKRGSTLSNMRKMAAHSLTLPVHQNMSQDDLDRMIDVLRSVNPS